MPEIGLINKKPPYSRATRFIAMLKLDVFLRSPPTPLLENPPKTKKNNSGIWYSLRYDKANDKIIYTMPNGEEESE